METILKKLYVAALSLYAAAAPAGAATISPPAYPPGLAAKPLVVNVVARAAPGDPGEVAVLFCDGDAVFANAAVAAVKSAMPAAPTPPVTLWFQFRLLEPTSVTDLSDLSPTELDAPPELIKTVKPSFPPGAPSLRTEVAMNLLIGTDGKVWYAEATTAEVPALYAERALEAARQFEFTPATKQGKPTPYWYPFVIDFK